MTTGIIDRIRAQKFYAGQIGRIDIMPPEKFGLNAGGEYEAASERIAEVLKDTARESGRKLLKQLFRSHGFSVVYEHQEKAMSAALAGRDVLLATGEGSGRSACMDMLAICRGLVESKNTLLISSNDREAVRRLEACRNTLHRIGLDYVLRAVSITDYHDASIPEIVVTTPRQLITALESGQNIPPSFFASLSLIIAEDISDYVGIYGANVAAVFRCLSVLTRRFGARPPIMATGLPYANLRSFAAGLFNRDLAGAQVVVEDGAPARQHPLVFWRAPMVFGNDKNHCERKDLLKDIKELVDFLSRDGFSSDSARRAFCFLLDKSTSMDAPKKFVRVKDAVIADIDEREKDGIMRDEDSLEIHFFDHGLHKAAFSGPISDFDESAKNKIRAVKSGGYTSIGKSLKEFFQEAEKPEGDETIRYVFIYSDGEDSIDSDMARGVKEALSKLTSSGQKVYLYYISLGIEPDATVRTLVEELGGIVEESAQGAEINPPSNLLNQKEGGERAVVLMSFTEALAINDFDHIGGNLRPINFVPRITHPELSALIPLDAWSPEVLRRAKYIVVVGWNSSPALLYYYLRHAGAADTMVFLVDIPIPSSRLITRRWTRLAEAPVPDRLSLTPYHEAISLRAIQSLIRYTGRLSEDEMNQILQDRLKEPKKRANVKSLLKMSQAFHVADDAMRLYLEGVNDPLFVDASLGLHRFYTGAVGVLNGRRYTIQESDGCTECRLSIANPELGSWTHPVFDLKVSSICDAASTGPDDSRRRRIQLTGTGIRALACQDDTVVRIIPKGYRHFEHGRAGAVGAELGAAGMSVAIKTRVLELDLQGASLSEEVKCGLENIFWHFIHALTPCEVRPFCIFDRQQNTNRIYIGELTPGDTGLVSTLLEDAGALLSKALQYGALAMLSCPCQTVSALESFNQAISEGGASIDDIAKIMQHPKEDCGCEYCLRAAAKSWGFPGDKALKKETIEFLGNHGAITDSDWQQSVRDKYDKIDREDRLHTGLLPEILQVMGDKIGARIPDDKKVPCRFMNNAESRQNAHALGLYCHGKEILLRQCPEFAMIDVLSHEYGHNWADAVCQEGYGWRHRYDDEFVEDSNNDLFRGVMFIEGAAVWIESHVTEFFSNRDRIGVNAFRSGNEYWEGFRLFKYVEKKYGMQAVLDMLKDGKLPQGVEKIERLLTDSGVNGSVQHAGTEAINDGRLACLQHLGRDSHKVSLSAYFKSGQTPIDWPDIADFGERERETVRQILRHGFFSLRSLLDKVAGVQDYVEESMPGLLEAPNAADMRLELACHLYSSAQSPRDRYLADVIKIVEDFMQSVTLPSKNTKKPS